MRTVDGNKQLPRIGVGAICGPVCSSVGCTQQMWHHRHLLGWRSWGVEAGVRSPSSLLLAGCIHVPCTTLMHRANYEVVPTGTASARNVNAHD
jgi:hypothetical protein